MYIEIQVASNFIASLLYNRLPRRRVNIFSEELEKALREKFTGHWYPSLPEKGSGFRCIKVGRVFDPPDAVLNKAAVESGTPINEIVENLPEELTLWIDPGEVSYRIGERKPVKVLYFERASSDSKNHNSSSSSGSSDDGSGDASGKATVLAIDAGSPTFMSDLEDTCAGAANGTSFPPFKPTTVASVNGPDSPALPAVVGAVAAANASPVMNARLTPRFKNVKMLNNNTTGMMNFATRCQTPTFTTASFAQTKFGSTKLKTNSKRTNRMSPTEFSNYIKQRAQMQQMNQSHPLSPMMSPRPLSPQIRSFGENYFFASNGNANAANSAAINGFRAGSSGNGGSMLDMGSSGSSDSSSFGGASSSSSKYSFLDEGSSPFFNHSSTSSSLSSSLSPIGTPPASLLLNGAGGVSEAGHSTSPSSSSSSATSKHSIQQEFDFLDNLNFAANSTAANSYNHPYQQLLLAN